MYNYEHRLKNLMVWDEYTKTVHTGFHYVTQGNFTSEEDRHMFRLAVEYNTTGYIKVEWNPRNLRNLYIDISKEEFIGEINENLKEID